jgi:hypothetical protein
MHTQIDVKATPLSHGGIRELNEEFFDRLEKAGSVELPREARDFIAQVIWLHWFMAGICDRWRAHSDREKEILERRVIDLESLIRDLSVDRWFPDVWYMRGDVKVTGTETAARELTLLKGGLETKLRTYHRLKHRHWNVTLKDELIADLAYIYHKVGGKVGPSWTGEDREHIGGPFARFLAVIWEVMPGKTRMRTSNSFARRSKTILPKLRDATSDEQREWWSAFLARLMATQLRTGGEDHVVKFRACLPLISGSRQDAGVGAPSPSPGQI